MSQFAGGENGLLILVFEVFRDFLDGVDFDQVFVPSVLEEADAVDVGDGEGTDG